jgi:hypothetical protein
MARKIGVPAVIAVVALAVAALSGALIASAIGGDDGDGEERGVALAAPAAAAGQPADAGSDAPAPATEHGPLVESDGRPLDRAEADRVARAAIDAVGGGTATEVDRSDDPGEAFEVEVATSRGEIDVALDAQLRRVTNAPYDD